MNKDTLKGKWKEYQGHIKEKWGNLTDDDLTEIEGKRDVLIGKLQTRYGYAKDRAEKELKDFEKNFCDSDSDDKSDKSCCGS